MTKALDKLDRALDVGREELALLCAGEIERAQELALRRGTLIAEAARCETAGLDSATLSRLKTADAQHRRICSEAERQQQSIREALSVARLESRRMSGYRNGAKVTPIASRFVSKLG